MCGCVCDATRRAPNKWMHRENGVCEWDSIWPLICAEMLQMVIWLHAVLIWRENEIWVTHVLSDPQSSFVKNILFSSKWHFSLSLAYILVGRLVFMQFSEYWYLDAVLPLRNCTVNLKAASCVQQHQCHSVLLKPNTRKRCCVENKVLHRPKALLCFI